MVENFQAAAERRKLESRMKHRQAMKDEPLKQVIGGKSKSDLENDIAKAQLAKLNYQESRKVKPLSEFMEKQTGHD